MPIYEYACTACGERTEARQSFNDPPLEECPHCGGKLRKLYSPVGIVFKGTGFYATDGHRAKPKTEDKKGEGASKTTESKSGKTSDPRSSKSSSGSKSTTSEKKN